MVKVTREKLDIVYPAPSCLHPSTFLANFICIFLSLCYPVVKVIHEKLGIVRGAITTIHNLTNTQVRACCAVCFTGGGIVPGGTAVHP